MDLSLVNIIGIILGVIIVAAGVVIKIKVHKKVEDLNGFCGIAEKGDLPDNNDE